MTISLCETSVDVFVPYLGNLSTLLDHASTYSKAKNIDPAILLDMRLYPNMYNLTRQVGEGNRHAVVACALRPGASRMFFRWPSRIFPSSNAYRGSDRLCAKPATRGD